MGYPALNDSQHHDNQGSIFSRLGGELSAARTPMDAARTILKAADQLLHWDAYVFNLLSNTSENVMSILCVDTVDGMRKEFTPDVNSSKIGQIARQSMKEGGKLILRAPGNLLPEEAIAFGNKSRPSASLMYVPLRKGAQTLGFLSLQSYSFHAYTEEDLTTLQALADHCGGALERIRAEAEVERLNQELRHRLQELHVLNAELEDRVQQRTAELGAINKELQAFCYSVSHDLRAPLRSIRGFSEVLLERYSSVLDERGLEYLKRVCQSCQHMDLLVEDLLKLSRLSRAELKPKNVDLSALCDSILSELNRSEPAREVELSVEPGLHAIADERLIRVVLENLLRNAWKFSSKLPRAKIEFGYDPTEAAFFVRDNGAGFDMTYVDRLFAVFQRLHTSSEFPGAGVGLAIVQRIINRHGGRVCARGAPNQGATFYFTLPAEQKVLLEEIPALPVPAGREYITSKPKTGSAHP